MRPLTLRNSDYNEYFTPGSLLVEIGAAGNSLDEALKAVRVFGEVLRRWSPGEIGLQNTARQGIICGTRITRRDYGGIEIP